MIYHLVICFLADIIQYSSRVDVVSNVKKRETLEELLEMVSCEFFCVNLSSPLKEKND